MKRNGIISNGRSGTMFCGTAVSSPLSAGRSGEKPIILDSAHLENGTAQYPPSAKTFPSATHTAAEVAILLCVCNGQNYLAQQLDSFETQTHANWKLYASDDGSKDGTRAILELYKSKWGEGRLSIHSGPQAGFTANFLSLACMAGIEADYYAFSDQDDVWENDKLERALAWMQTIPPSVPALYCTRTRLVNESGHVIGFSALFRKAPSFSNALVQNIGGGNTMVFNEAARELLREAGSAVNVVAHDWWTYMLVTGCGGRVFYDPQPSVRYRQHADNAIGASSGFLKEISNTTQIIRGRFRRWNDLNLAALARHRSRLTEENRRIFDIFSESRTKPFIPRIAGTIKSGVTRQTLLGYAGLLIAAAFKRL